MFGKCQVNLPSQFTTRSTFVKTETPRLNNECVEFCGAMARAGQLPSHRSPSRCIHIDIKPQMRMCHLRETQIESETRAADLSRRVETFKFCDSGLDEGRMHIVRTDAAGQKYCRMAYYLINSLWILGSLMSLMNFSTS
jgi:hypothetical protein